MKVSFGEPARIARWAELDATDRLRAALFWVFNGGPKDRPDIDELLQSPDARRFEIQGARGFCGSFWQFYDAGLLFAPGSALIVGEAVQHGFVCRDRALWKSLAEADDQPGPLDWSMSEDEGEEERLWMNPPDPEEAVRLVTKSRT